MNVNDCSYKRLKIGDNIYQPVEYLGKGGYATAISAKLINDGDDDDDDDENDDDDDDDANITPTMVAIKVINTNKFDIEKIIDYTEKEIIIMKRLEHRNILKLYYFAKDEHLYYLVLELCSNKTLNHLIKNNNFIMNNNDIKYLFHQMANGCHYLHDKLIIHRDIKPDNILLDEHFIVKIADFGLAITLDDPNDLLFTYCGTPKYQAPELINGKGYNFGVDMWAMGCTIYRLFYGNAPFEGKDTTELHNAIINRNAKYSRTTKNDQAVHKEDIHMLKCLICKDKHKRLTSIQLIGKKKYFHFQTSDVHLFSLNIITTNPLKVNQWYDEEKRKLCQMINNLNEIIKQSKVKKQLSIDYMDYNCDIMRPNDWIEQWLKGDFFGFGYRTKAKLFGCNFNDNTRTLLINRFIFFWSGKLYEKYNIEQCPPKLMTKVKILTKLKKILIRKLKLDNNGINNNNNNDSSIEQSASTTNESLQRLPWLLKYIETKRAIVFHLSNGLFQISFPEKILLFDTEHNSMTIINTIKHITLTLSLNYIQQQDYISEYLYNYLSVSLSYIQLLFNAK